MVILIIFTMMSTSSCFLLTYSAELWVDNWTTYDLSIYADDTFLGYVDGYGDETFLILLDGASETIYLEAYFTGGGLATYRSVTMEFGESYSWTIYAD
jgi:hypothetical protein